MVAARVSASAVAAAEEEGFLPIAPATVAAAAEEGRRGREQAER
jgi:hypothetical protein